MADDDDNTIPSAEDGLLKILGLDAGRWSLKGVEVVRGNVGEFSDTDPDMPVAVTMTDDLKTLDRGSATVRISCRHGLRHECPCCGKPMAVKCWVENTYRSSPIIGMRTDVCVSVPKMHCRICGTYRKVRCPLVVENHTYTRLLKLDVLSRLQDDTPKSVAEGLGIGLSTVYDILRDAISEGLVKQDLSGVRILYIDEIQSTHGQNYITMVADQDHRAICGVKGHDIGSVREVRDRLIEKGGDPKRIQYVSADMSVAYRAGVRECFPGAKLIIDVFHLDKAVNDTVDKVRKRTNRELEKAGLEYPKKVKYTVLFRQRNHDGKHAARMRQIRLYNKDLALAFDLKEEFFELFSCGNRKQARSAFFSWYNRCRGSHIPEMVDVARRMLKRLNDILRYFDCRITNAVSEGMNSVYKRIKQAAYGYRKEENLIGMCLFRKGRLTVTI